jgi:hypothetical protein
MSDNSMLAAVTAEWLCDHVPEQLLPVLLDRIDSWTEAGSLPPTMLWTVLANGLQAFGCVETEEGLCRLALSLRPNQPTLQLRLAEILARLGRHDQAQPLLRSLAMSGVARLDALVRLLDMPGLSDKPQLLDEAEELAAQDGNWSNGHTRCVRHLIQQDGKQRAFDFMRGWTDRWPVQPEQLQTLGILAMEMGQPQVARSIFTSIWQSVDSASANMVGDFDGTIPPYDLAWEAELSARIEAAFALDEDGLAALPRAPDRPATPPHILFVTFAHRALPNDLAEHLAGSARAAAIDLEVYADSTLILPDEAATDDQSVADRLAAFQEHVERTRPQILVLDCCARPGMRGLNPANMAELRARCGFRLVVLSRDAHSFAVPILRQWLTVCDTMTVFDPTSPLFKAEPEQTADKVITLPVPAMHGPFLERRPRQPGLLFIGAVNYSVRHAFLSVLMTEEIGFRTVIGDARAKSGLDTAGYAAQLNGAQAVLNFSIHTPVDHLITGRVWESIAAGALLVEQDNASTASVLTPYRHYLPWRSVSDIVQIARFIERHPDQAARIALEAHGWARRRYGPEAFWLRLLDHALRPRDEAVRRSEQPPDDWLYRILWP